MQLRYHDIVLSTWLSHVYGKALLLKNACALTQCILATRERLIL